MTKILTTPPPLLTLMSAANSTGREQSTPSASRRTSEERDRTIAPHPHTPPAQELSNQRRAFFLSAPPRISPNLPMREYFNALVAAIEKIGYKHGTDSGPPERIRENAIAKLAQTAMDAGNTRFGNMIFRILHARGNQYHLVHNAIADLAKLYFDREKRPPSLYMYEGGYSFSVNNQDELLGILSGPYAGITLSDFVSICRFCTPIHHLAEVSFKPNTDGTLEVSSGHLKNFGHFARDTKIRFKISHDRYGLTFENFDLSLGDDIDNVTYGFLDRALLFTAIFMKRHGIRNSEIELGAKVTRHLKNIEISSDETAAVRFTTDQMLERLTGHILPSRIENIDRLTTKSTRERIMIKNSMEQELARALQEIALLNAIGDHPNWGKREGNDPRWKDDGIYLPDNPVDADISGGVETSEYAFNPDED